MIKSLQRKLNQLRKQPELPRESPDSKLSRKYAFQKEVPVSIVKICDLLLYIDPLWSMGAAVFVYLSIFQIVGGYSWFGLIMAVLPFIARWISRGYLSRPTPFDLPIGLLLISGLIGIGVSIDKSLSWNVYQTLLISVLFYYSFINYDHPRLLMKGGLLIAALALIVLVPYIWLQQPTSLPFYSQLQSWLYPNPESLPSEGEPLAGSACGVTVAAEVVTVILAGIAILPGKKTTRIEAGILTILLLGVLVISGCHATWPVLMIGMLFVLTWRSKWFLFSIPAWLGIIYLSLATWRDLNLGQSISWITEVLKYKWDVRWEGTLSMLADRPITSWGLGMYPTVYSEYDIRGPQIHNAYLQFLSDFGLLGVVALILAAIIFVMLVLQVRKSSSNHPWLGITVGASAAILVGAIYSMVESAPACIWALATDDSYYYAISPLFVILVAALVVSYRSLMVQNYTSKIEEGSQMLL